MNKDPTRLRTSSWPLGLIGMLVLIAGVESFIAGRDLDFINASVASWRYAASTARTSTREAEILCLGTSLTKDGVLPRVMEKQLGRPTQNLAVFAGPMAASYYLLKHALERGARPKVVLLDCQDAPNVWENRHKPHSNLWAQVRQWPEILDARESLELAWTMRDARLFGVLASSLALPSSRARFEIRASILSALRGRSSSSLLTVAAVRRNWRINGGAHVMAEITDSAQPTIAQLHGPEAAHLLRKWGFDRFGESYAQRLMDLTARYGIAVLWLFPPVGPETLEYRDRTGLTDYFNRLARSIQARYSHVVVIDGRDSGYPPRAFSDLYHLNARGALAYSHSLARIIEQHLADPSNLPRWVALPAYREVEADVPIEDIDQSRLAIIKLNGGSRLVR